MTGLARNLVRRWAAAAGPMPAFAAALLAIAVACAPAWGQSTDPNKPIPKPDTKPSPDPFADAAGEDEAEEVGVVLRAPSYGLYDALLERHLVRRDTPEGPVTGFDYHALKRAETESRLLSRIRAALLEVPPSRMGHHDRIAWTVNLYNLLVIERVAEHLNAAGPDSLLGSVRDLRTPAGGFFDAPVVEIEGLHYSLDAFERRFLFEDFDRQSGAPPPPTLDPRLHFALVCAARGCPPLQGRAYRGGSLGRELDAVTRRALASPRHLQWDAAAGRLTGSAIFEWYAADFGGPEGAFAFLVRHAPAERRAAIEKAGIRRLHGTISWDWGLNHLPARAARRR